jgi:hypothetical protein
VFECLFAAASCCSFRPPATCARSWGRFCYGYRAMTRRFAVCCEPAVQLRGCWCHFRRVPGARRYDGCAAGTSRCSNGVHPGGIMPRICVGGSHCRRKGRLKPVPTTEPHATGTLPACTAPPRLAPTARVPAPLLEPGRLCTLGAPKHGTYRTTAAVLDV